MLTSVTAPMFCGFWRFGPHARYDYWQKSRTRAMEKSQSLPTLQLFLSCVLWRSMIRMIPYDYNGFIMWKDIHSRSGQIAERVASYSTHSRVRQVRNRLRQSKLSLPVHLGRSFNTKSPHLGQSDSTRSMRAHWTSGRHCGRFLKSMARWDLRQR